MKKFVAVMLAAVLSAGMIGCTDDGGNFLPLLGLTGGSESASIKYLEFMYDDDNGKSLDALASGGVELTPAMKEKIGNSLNSSLIVSTGIAVQNPESSNWWERMDVDAEKTTAFLGSSEGEKALEAYFSDKMASRQSASADAGSLGPKPYWQIAFAVIDTAINIASLVNDINAANAKKHAMSKSNNIAILAVIKLFEMNQTLQNIQDMMEAEFKRLNYKIDTLLDLALSEGFRNARNRLYSAMDEFSNLYGVDPLYRTEAIKSFFTIGYEKTYNEAFTSSLERFQWINSQAAADAKLPGNMLISDILFLRQMSEMRIAYASFFYSRNRLLNFRANVAKSDMKRLRVIKGGFVDVDHSGDDSEYVNDALVLIISWEIVLRSHIAAYEGNDVREIDLEAAKNVMNGFATFGDIDGENLGAACGETLTIDSLSPLHALFNYGDSLESVFDEGVSGDMDGGRFLRIVHAGRNILSDMGLVPVMKRLQTRSEILSPIGKECFVDPALGRLVLPRPVYWSRCESDVSMTSPEIYVPDYPPVINRAGAVYSGGKFGSGWGKFSALWDESYTMVKPFGNSHVAFMEKGGVSVWWMTSSWGQNANQLKINITDTTYIIAHINKTASINRVDLYAGGANPVSSATEVINFDLGNHLYVIWDKDGFKTDGSLRIKVFLNGQLVLFTNSQVTGDGPLSAGVASVFNIGGGSSAIDNLKIWNHVVSEDPGFEWNGGAGREKALHEIYGPDDEQEFDYRPKLTGNGNGVGYYYMP